MSTERWPHAFGLVQEGDETKVVWSSDDDSSGPVSPPCPPEAKSYVDGEHYDVEINLWVDKYIVLEQRVAELEKAILAHQSYMQRFNEGKAENMPYLRHDAELYSVLQPIKETDNG